MIYSVIMFEFGFGCVMAERGQVWKVVHSALQARLLVDDNLMDYGGAA